LAEPARYPQDVGLADTAAALVQSGQVAGFNETVHGIVASVRQALEKCRPDAFTVEFGIELSARSGKALSVLAEAGGTAHIKVTASWAGEGRASAGEAGDAS